MLVGLKRVLVMSLNTLSSQRGGVFFAFFDGLGHLPQAVSGFDSLNLPSRKMFALYIYSE